MKLRVRPWTVKRETALAFNQRTHRRLPKVQGAMWAIAAWKGDEIVGSAVVGWPPARKWTNQEVDTLCVLRVAVKDDPDRLGKGHRDVCSMLYMACWRAARAMGTGSLVTYTHLDESGVSLKACGWIDGGLTEGGEWDSPSRPRQMAIDSERKRRWWAPGSLRALVPVPTAPPKQCSGVYADACDRGRVCGLPRGHQGDHGPVPTAEAAKEPT